MHTRGGCSCGNTPFSPFTGAIHCAFLFMAQVISKVKSLYQGAFVGVVRAPVATDEIRNNGDDKPYVARRAQHGHLWRRDASRACSSLSLFYSVTSFSFSISFVVTQHTR